MKLFSLSPQQKTVLRALFGLSIAGFLIYKIVIRSQVDIIHELQGCYFAFGLIAFMLYGTAMGIGLVRWNLLLRTQNIRLTPIELIRLYMIGVFFNLLIPGSVGGDLIKMVYIARAYPRKKSEAILTIVMDRIVGLLGLFFIAALSVLLSWNYIQHASDALKLGALIVAGGSIMGILTLGMIASWPYLRRFQIVIQLIGKAQNVLPPSFVEQIARIGTAFALFGINRKIMSLTLIISLGVHVILGGEIYAIGKCFREENVNFKQYLLFTQIANCAGAIPITPSGIGSRDLVLSLYLQEAGAAREKTGIIPTLNTLIVMLWSLIGGVFFIAGGKQLVRRE